VLECRWPGCDCKRKRGGGSDEREKDPNGETRGMRNTEVLETLHLENATRAGGDPMGQKNLENVEEREARKGPGDE